MLKGFSALDETYLLEGSLEDKLIPKGRPAGTPTNKQQSSRNMAVSVQFLCSAATGDIKHYTVLIKTKGLSV